MASTTSSEPTCMATDADGVVRIGGTRVTLDTVVAAFQKGMSPEGICEQYPVLVLADVYYVIGYLLSHPDQVSGYLQQREQFAAQVRAQNEAKFDPVGVRQRLLSRRSAE